MVKKDMAGLFARHAWCWPVLPPL